MPGGRERKKRTASGRTISPLTRQGFDFVDAGFGMHVESAEAAHFAGRNFQVKIDWLAGAAGRDLFGIRASTISHPLLPKTDPHGVGFQAELVETGNGRFQTD